MSKKATTAGIYTLSRTKTSPANSTQSSRPPSPVIQHTMYTRVLFVYVTQSPRALHRPSHPHARIPLWQGSSPLLPRFACSSRHPRTLSPQIISIPLCKLPSANGRITYRMTTPPEFFQTSRGTQRTQRRPQSTASRRM